MKNRSNDAQRMIQLTLSNAVDQTQKIRVEVPMGTNIKQATEDAGLAPSSTFDVFTAEGEVVTAHPVDQYSDNTLYVGPQKVAGGAWGDEDFELKPEDGVQTLTEPPEKAIVFTSAFDSTIRNEVVPQPDQTVKAAAQMAGLAPRDGSAWQVFDAIGEIVEDRPAQEYAGDLLYVGPQAIVGGGVVQYCDMGEMGVNTNEFNRLLKIPYPGTHAIRQHRLESGNIGAIVIRMRGKEGHRHDKTIKYEILIDLRNFPYDIPHAYVMTPECDDISHCNIHYRNRFEVAPRRDLCSICIGAEYKIAFTNLPRIRETRLVGFLYQLQYVLSNPNPDDKAREV